MRYSFFGTCANDYKEFFGCLDTILEQSYLPKQIILINSGEKDIKKEIFKKLNDKNISLVYVFEKLSRVKALNIAIDKINTDFSFRFDTRARFAKNYAKNALKIINDKKIGAEVVGGVPYSLNKKNSFESLICSEIMNRPYIFFYPKHRNIKYSGYASSIYLGCFRTTILKQIKFNEKESLLSEDSLIINDFIEKGFKAYISSTIKISYLSRSSFLNLLKLFNTYGFCRANTILLTRKIFISLRHFFVFLNMILCSILLLKNSLLYFIFLPAILLIINLIGEFFYIRKFDKLQIPFCGTLCQFSWIIGFCWSLISIFRKKAHTNFIS